MRCDSGVWHGLRHLRARALKALPPLRPCVIRPPDTQGQRKCQRTWGAQRGRGGRMGLGSEPTVQPRPAQSVLQRSVRTAPHPVPLLFRGPLERAWLFYSSFRFPWTSGRTGRRWFTTDGDLPASPAWPFISAPSLGTSLPSIEQLVMPGGPPPLSPHHQGGTGRLKSSSRADRGGLLARLRLIACPARASGCACV